MATNVMGVMKMETIVCLEWESNPFQTSVLTITPRRLPDMTTLPTPPCLHLLASEASADYDIQPSIPGGFKFKDLP